MLHDQTIVCFSSIDWDATWQIHQEVMSALARAGNRVLFVENTGVRRPFLRDLPRLRRRLHNWRTHAAAHKLPSNLRVVSPLVLPFPYAAPVVAINAAVLGRSIRRELEALGARRPIAWVFLPTPIVLRLLRTIEPLLTIYYCADDFSSSSPEAAPVAESEQRLLQMADLVFATSSRLVDRARRQNPRVHRMPAGVAFERFEEVRLSDSAPPDDLRALPRPIVGYVGGVNQRIDEELVVEVARRLPSFSFVFVGPTRGDMSAIRRCANVHLLGPRPHDQIPHYIKGFDVAVIPYRLTAFTHHIYPVKLNEYLAMGVPVVSTGLLEIRAFVGEHPGAAAIAGTVDEFVAATHTAVRFDRDEARARRVEIARANSWTSRLTRMNAIIKERLSDADLGSTARPPGGVSRPSGERR